MVDPVLSFASVALSTSVQGSRLLSALRGSENEWKEVQNSDHGRAYRNFLEWKENRAILQAGREYRIFQNLYDKETEAEPSTLYVLHDASGKGKSMGAISLLREFYQADDDSYLKGIMLSPKGQEGSYMEAISQLLEVSKVEGWLNLLLVLNEEIRKLPSILVLDDFFFDSEGRNKNFISYIYNTLKCPGENRFNIVVVVITKERGVADELCGMNGGERIRPMPGCYETKEDNVISKMLRTMNIQGKNHSLIHPTWKPVTWTRDLLIEAVRYEYPPDVLAPISSLNFIEEGMTPLKACNLVLKKIQGGQRGKLPSPRQTAGQQFFPPNYAEAAGGAATTTAAQAGVLRAATTTEAEGNNNNNNSFVSCARRYNSAILRFYSYVPGRQEFRSANFLELGNERATPERRGFYSFTAGVAIKIGNEILQIAKDGSYHIHGHGSVAGGIEESTDRKELDIVSGFPLHHSKTKYGHHYYYIVLGDHEEIVIKSSKKYMAVKVESPSQEHFGGSVGLLGSFGKGDMLAPDGFTNLMDADEYGQEWQVLESEPMLFQSLRAPQHPQKCIPAEYKSQSRRLAESKISLEKAESACSHAGDDFDSCVFDVIATGDLDMADASFW